MVPGLPNGRADESPEVAALTEALGRISRDLAMLTADRDVTHVARHAALRLWQR